MSICVKPDSNGNIIQDVNSLPPNCDFFQLTAATEGITQLDPILIIKYLSAGFIAGIVPILFVFICKQLLYFFFPYFKK